MPIDPPSVDSIFLAALERSSPEERAAYLDAACGDDTELRQRVERLLAAHPKVVSFLESPAPGIAATLDQPATETLGTYIDRYKLVHEIGHGGMGVVYMAVQKEPVKRKVALKVIKPGMDTKEVVARFNAERQALALMDHQCIATVLDGGSTPSGRPYFVMELVDGTPITEYCDACRFTTGERLELFIKVCQAVQHAHQKGVIHRDIKPSNILVTNDDTVAVPKVIDFGIAKAVHQPLTDASVYTNIQQMVGTPLYMSPEQAQRTAHDIDTRTDVYSLGVLLYELLTGTTPFDKERLKNSSLDEVKRIIREEEPPRPSTRLTTLDAALETVAEKHHTDPRALAQQISGELDWIVMKALEKDRNRRYETASDFAKDVQRYLDDDQVEACPPTSAYRLRKFARRNKGALSTGALLLLVLIVGAGIATWQAVRAGRAERQTKASLDEAKEQRDAARVATQEAETERQKTEAERQKAEAVLEFLVESLRSPDPERDGRTITVAELIDRAVEALDLKFPDQPLARAELAHAIGETYVGLGLYDKAIPVLELARSIRQAELGENHEDTLLAMTALGVAYRDSGQLAKALPLLEQSLEKQRENFGDDHVHTIDSMAVLSLAYKDAGQWTKALALQEEVHERYERIFGLDGKLTNTSANNLALIYARLKQYDKALPLLERVLERRRTTLGEDDPATIISMANLGTTYRQAGQLSRAVDLQEKTLEKAKVVFGLEHPYTLTCMGSLASAYKHVGQMDDALPLYVQSFEGKKATLGPDHPKTITALFDLALLYRKLEQFDKALPLLTQVVEKRKAILGADHRDTLTAMFNLAVAYGNDAQYEKAFPLYEEVLERRTALFGPDDYSTLQSKNQLAMDYQRTEQFDKALPLFEDLLEKFMDIHGPDHPGTLIAMHNLAFSYSSVKAFDKALPLFEKVLAKERAKLSPHHPRTIETMDCLATAYAQAEQYEKAVELRREVLEALRQQRPPDVSKLASNLAVLTTCLLKLGKFEQAESYARESVTIRQKEMPDNWLLFNSKSLLGASLAGQEKYAEAEPLLIEAYEGIQSREDQLPVKFQFRMTEALQRIIDLYDAWDKPEQAAPWREKIASEPETTDGD